MPERLLCSNDKGIAQVINDLSNPLGFHFKFLASANSATPAVLLYRGVTFYALCVLLCQFCASVIYVLIWEAARLRSCSSMVL